MFSGRDGRCAYVSENWKGVKRVVRARMYARVCVCDEGVQDVLKAFGVIVIRKLLRLSETVRVKRSVCEFEVVSWRWLKGKREGKS